MIRKPKLGAVLALVGALSLIGIRPAVAVEYQYDAFGVPNMNVLNGTASVTIVGTASLGVVTQGASGSATQVWRTDLENPDGGTYAKVTASKALQVDTGAASGSFPSKATLTNGDGSALSATTGPFVQQGASASLSGAWPITPIIGGSAATGANSIPIQGATATGSAALGNPSWTGGIDSNGKLSGVTVVSTTSAGGGLLSVSATLTGTGSLGTVTQGASATLPWKINPTDPSGNDLTDSNGMKVDVKALVALPTGANTIGAVTQAASGSLANAWGVTPVMGGSVATGASSWQIQGAAASESAEVGSPLQIAGQYGGTLKTIKTASDGTVRIDPSGTTTQPVSGTVTSTQGASASLPWKANPTDPSGNDLTDANGVKVDVKVLPALPTGANTIGAVTQGASTSLPWPVLLTNPSGTSLLTGSAVNVNLGAASSSLPAPVTRTTADGATNEDSSDVPSVSSVTLAAGGGATQLVSATSHITGFTIVPWSGAVFVGPSGVTLTSGFPVSASQSYGVTCFTCTAWYATGSNNVTVRVIKYTDR